MSLVCVEKGQMFVPLGMSKFSTLLLALLATAVLEAVVSQMAAPALAGPVVCTTTLEASASDFSAGSALVPVEVTTCGPTETHPHCSIGGFHLDSALCLGDWVSLTKQLFGMLSRWRTPLGH